MNAPSKPGLGPPDIVDACGLKLFCHSPVHKSQLPAGLDLRMLKDKVQRDLWRERVKGRQLKRILELGIFNGGSIPWLYETCQADFIVGVDISKPKPQVIKALARSTFAGKYALYFQTDQADQKALTKIVNKHFNGELDLVVDDASHLLHLTRRSFEILFPKLRAGGLYVIEDYFAGQKALNKDRLEYPALTQIALELTMLLTSNKGWIKDIKIDSNTITLERGETPLPKPFRIKSAVKNWAGLDMKSLRALGVFKPKD